MVEVKPVNFGNPLNIVGVYGTSKVQEQQKVSRDPLYVDCTDLYTPEEIEQIRLRVGLPKMPFPSKYVVHLFNDGTLVINNKSVTNDTLEISKDGSVRHVGSWHNNKLADKGSFNDITEDARKRLKNKEK